MRKTIVERQNLISLSKEGSIDLLKKEYLGMGDFEVDGDTHYSRINTAAELIVKGCLKKGIKVSDALAQITYANIAPLVTQWDDPENNIRDVGSALSKHYSRRNKGGDRIATLRSEVLAQISNKKHVLLNHEKFNETCCGVEYSQKDKLDGLKLPEKFDINHFFLMGLYRADGTIYQKKNAFCLYGKSGDEKLYRGVIENMVKKSFNIDTNTKSLKRSKNGYEWSDISMRIVSKGHFQYLQEHVGLFDSNGEFNELDIVKIGEKKSLEQDYRLAYFMGMIAGGGHIGVKSNSKKLLLQLNDTNHDYIPEIQRKLSNHNELGLTYAYSEKKPKYMHFNQNQLEKMLAYEVPFRISNVQVGLIVNPRQIDMLKNYKFL